MGLQRHRERAGDLVDALVDGRYEEWRAGLAAASPERVGSALMVAVNLSARDKLRQGAWWSFRELLPSVLRIPFTVTAEDAELAARTATRGRGWMSYVPLRLAEALAQQTRSVAAARLLLAALDHPDGPYGGDRSSIRTRLIPLLAEDDTAAHDLSLIIPGDGWAKAVVTELAEEPAPVVNAVLRQLAGATGSKPGKAWARATAALLEDPAAVRVVRSLLARVADAEPVVRTFSWGPMPVVLDDRNADVVRASAWALVPVQADWVVPLLVAVAHRDLAPGEGAIQGRKVFNATVLALGMIGGTQAVTALARLDTLCRDNGDRKRIAAALELAGTAMGLTPGQVAERMVDGGGFTAEGYAEFERGPVRVRVLLGADLRLTVRWWSGVDWVAKVPAGAPESDVRALKRRVTEAKALVTAERWRVEGLFAQEREWDLAEWRQYYLAHPVTGPIAVRLLWTVDGVTGLPEGDRLTTVDGPVDLPRRGRVRLWHPARAATEEVAAWRRWLLEREFRQPVKQAFREVYLLTDAERETGTYSNRFAAHILRYPQTYALFKERAWVSNFLGPYDGGYEGRARREFRDAGLVAVFEHFAVDAAQDAAQLCSTDRVWFHQARDRAKTPVPLTEVPPLVFTEAMRDVDLFVGVSSIALDPNWLDRGDAVPHWGYWQHASFGELSARSLVRRDVLAHLLPKLAVADRVELLERSVRVRGRLGTYRVHIGSGNVLIEPDDRYLCIVPSGRSRDRVLLPFEGDDMLSVVLSKVALLARDDRITDPAITHQLRARH